MLKPIAPLLLVFLLLSPYATPQTSRPKRPSELQKNVDNGPVVMEPKQILQRESPAIVTVYSVDKSGKPFALGSGFVVRPNGVVITNYHVIKGASDAQIKLKNGEIYENVLVLDYDKRRDIVVLKIRAVGLPTVTLGDSTSAEPGDRAYAIGNPEGYDYTISDGLISARRIIEGTEELQITVPISHGSSGGPLYNVYGQVIGITAAGYMEGAQNLNFAVPLKYVLVMLDSPPQNLTLAQLTEKMQPVEEAAKTDTSNGGGEATSGGATSAYVDPSGWLELTLPPGWRLEDPPPKDMMLAATRGDAATLLAYRAADSRNADDAFSAIKKTISDKYGKLANYSEKVKTDYTDGRRIRMQTFRMNEGLVFIGALQHDERIIGMLGVCSTTDAYDELVKALETIRW